MNVEDFEKSCQDGEALFKIKNEEYGDSVEDTGCLGAVVECVAKVARLRQLVLRSADHGRGDRDAVFDSLMDLHNYAAIAIYMLRTENWEGR